MAEGSSPKLSHKFRRGIPLADLTTWRIGGPAELLAEPESIEELIELAAYASASGLPVTLLGRGSNVLVDDSGIRGLVICTRRMRQAPVFIDETVRVVAGCPMPQV